MKHQNSKSNKVKNFKNKKSMKMSFKDDKNQVVEAPTGRGANDISWYTKCPTLLDPAVLLPANNITGQEYSISLAHVEKKDGQNYYTHKRVQQTAPGIMKIVYDPVIPTGDSTNSISTFTTVGKALYAEMRKVLNGPRPYNSADLMAYITTLSSVIGMMTHLRRAYQLTFYSNLFSRYSRSNLVNTLYKDNDSVPVDVYEYLVQQGPQFVSKYNAIVFKMRNLLMPVDIPLTARWVTLNGNIFKDADSERAQLYAFVPSSYYEVSYEPWHLGNTAAYELNRISYDGRSGNMIHYFLNKISTYVDTLLANDVVSIINADLLRVYGDDRLGRINPIDISETGDFNAVYNPEILMQIKHLTISAYTAANYKVNINKDGDFTFDLTYKARPEVTTEVNSWFMTGYGQHLNRDEVVLNTRLMTLSESLFIADVDQVSGFITHGTELVQRVEIRTLFNLPLVGSSKIDRISISSNLLEYNVSSTLSSNELNAYIFYGLNYLSLASNFTHAPLIASMLTNYIDGSNSPQAEYNTFSVFGETDSITTISKSQLERIHLAVNASLLGLEGDGRLTSALLGKKQS